MEPLKSTHCCPRFRLYWVFFLALLVRIPPIYAEIANPSSQDELVRSYEIRADFRSFKSRLLKAEMVLSIENRSKMELTHLDLMTYPNRFQRELANLNDVNLRRIYPAGISKGSMVLDKVRDESGTSLAVHAKKTVGVPDGCLLQLDLATPLKPKEKRKILLNYVVKVPHKFGSFGFYRGILTLSGGWFPYVVSFHDSSFHADDLPPRAAVDLTARVSSDIVIGSKVFRGNGAGKDIALKFPAAREISLYLADQFNVSELHNRTASVTLVSSKSQHAKMDQLSELVVQWFDFFGRQRLSSSGAPNLTVAVAPIRESMVIKGEELIYVSDRVFKVVGPLQQYHSVPVIHSLFYQLVFPFASERESSRDYHWVADAISWGWTQRYIEDRAYLHVDARTLPPIRIFKFLYAIDRLIYAPQFAFYDVFYNLVYPYDPVRDDPLTFNHERPFGRTIYAHMEDFLGEDAASKLTTEYLVSNQRLFDLVQSKTKAPIQNIFNQWISERPRINYKIAEFYTIQTENGFHHRLRVTKSATTTFVEPVEIEIRPKHEKPIFLKWNGVGDEKVYEFDTKEPVGYIELDPRQRLLETRLGDNRTPPRYKAVLTNYQINFDFNEHQPIGYASIQLRKEYGGFNLYNASAAYDVNSYGVGLSFTRLFGSLIDRLRLSHGIDIGYSFNRLDNDGAVAIDPATGAKTAVLVGPRALQSALAFTYFFGNELSLTNPMRGGVASASVVWGNKTLGGDSTYYQMPFRGSWIYPFHPDHLLALQGFFGISGDANIPSQVSYTLGGLSAMRGLNINDDQFKGRNMLLTSAEYRHLLIKDIDINLWVFRVRDIQGALFTDAGRVTDTIEERASRIAFGSPVHTSFSDLFDVTGYSADVGYGIRFLIDYLGVQPSLLRFDAAKSLTEDTGVRFYFAVTQSF